MSQIDMQRMALMVALGEKHGCPPDLAARASLAVHPLDDSPVPSRAFEKEVRKASRAFARELRKLSGQVPEIEGLTERTLSSYKEMAIRHGEAHYISRFDEAIGNV